MEPVTVVGTTVFVPSPEDLLLILCVHGSRHLWNRMKWICDVAELVRANQGMDWGQLVAQAENLGSERMLLLGLLLATDLLRAPLPDEILRRVRADPAAQSLAEQVYGRLFAEADQPEGVVRHFVFRTKVRERRRDRASSCLYLLRRTVTPNARDRALIRLPGPLGFLYYVFA